MWPAPLISRCVCFLLFSPNTHIYCNIKIRCHCFNNFTSLSNPVSWLCRILLPLWLNSSWPIFLLSINDIHQYQSSINPCFMVNQSVNPHVTFPSEDSKYLSVNDDQIAELYASGNRTANGMQKQTSPIMNMQPDCAVTRVIVYWQP